MKKRLLLSLLFTVNIVFIQNKGTLNGQNLTNNGFFWPFSSNVSGSRHVNNAILASDSSIIGLIQADPLWIGIFKADKDGNMLWLKKIGFSHRITATDLTRTNDGHMAMVLYGGDSLSANQVIKFTNQGDILWAKTIFPEFQLPTGHLIYHMIIPAPRGGVMLIAFDGCMGGPFIIRLDKDGGLMFSERHSSRNHITAVVQENTSNYTFIGHNREISAMVMGSLDTNGVISLVQNVQVMQYPGWMAASPHIFLMKTSSGGYYALSTPRITPGNDSFILIYMNNAWEQQWSRRYNLPAGSQSSKRSQLLPAPDNGVILITPTRFLPPPWPTFVHRTSLFMHIDSTGQILKARLPEDTSYSNRIGVIYEVADVIPLDQTGTMMAVGHSLLRYPDSSLYTSVRVALTITDIDLNGYCTSTPTSISSYSCPFSNPAPWAIVNLGTAQVSVVNSNPTVLEVGYVGFNICTRDSIYLDSNSPTKDDCPLVGVKIFPNPAEQYVTIEGLPQKAGNVKIQIHSMDGKLVYQNEIVSLADFRIDVSGFSKGVYLLSVQHKSHRVNLRLVR